MKSGSSYQNIDLNISLMQNFCTIVIISTVMYDPLPLNSYIYNLAIWCLRPWWVRILPSAEEDNLSPFDSNIACLCQSIEIKINKYVYRQSQVRMPNGCGVEWAECSLIIGTGCRVPVFAWSSIAQSVCQWVFSLLAIWCLRPWWVRILPSAEEDNLFPFDSNIACLCQSIEINNNKYICNNCLLQVPLYLTTREWYFSHHRPTFDYSQFLNSMWCHYLASYIQY